MAEVVSVLGKPVSMGPLISRLLGIVSRPTQPVRDGVVVASSLGHMAAAQAQAEQGVPLARALPWDEPVNNKFKLTWSAASLHDPFITLRPQQIRIIVLTVGRNSMMPPISRLSPSS